jgi:hypothetical protein
MIMNNEWNTMLQEVAKFKKQFRDLPWETEDHHKTPQSG